MIRFPCLSAALVALTLSGCAAIIPDAQRPEVQQGSLLDRSDIEQLHQGQTQTEVRRLIGTPILASPFQSRRWDYVYWRTHAGRKIDQRQILTLVFDEGGQLQRIVDRYGSAETPITGGDKQPLREQNKPRAPGGSSGSSGSSGPVGH